MDEKLKWLDSVSEVNQLKKRRNITLTLRQPLVLMHDHTGGPFKTLPAGTKITCTDFKETVDSGMGFSVFAESTETGHVWQPCWMDMGWFSELYEEKYSKKCTDPGH
jgi:hypothetical protein